MAFPIYLSPTTSSPPAAAIEADLRGAIAAAGGSIDPDGRTLHMPDGGRVEVDAATQKFSVEALSPSFCQVLFRAAQQSNATVDRGGSDLTPLKMRGSIGITRYVRMRTDTIDSPDDLCSRLHQDLQAWNQFVSESQKAGLVGPDARPLEPPGDPGSEARLDAGKSGVAEECEDTARWYEKRGWRIMRAVVSLNPTYGVVWRADYTTPGFRRMPWRMICWQARGTDGTRSLVVEDHPFEMFDSKESLHPLEAAPQPPR